MTTYTVIDPSGTSHTRRSTARTYTHAVIRQNKGEDTYYVNFATSEERAEKEARVLADLRSYIEVAAFQDGRAVSIRYAPGEPTREAPVTPPQDGDDSEYDEEEITGRPEYGYCPVCNSTLDPQARYACPEVTKRRPRRTSRALNR